LCACLYLKLSKVCCDTQLTERCFDFRCDISSGKGVTATSATSPLQPASAQPQEENLSNEWLFPVVACLRSAVVGNRKNEAFFVVSDGTRVLASLKVSGQFLR